ncbi:MAG: putative potassium transport system protein kup [Bacteroidia bacterium]|nr:MAG: putative potassium transport system protein kup [Bacteroidia bacterium]
MSGHKKHDFHQPALSLAGLVVSLGIVYGDIGTSPLYTLKAILGENYITADIVKGALSAIFWMLTMQTTVKYVILTLNADNKGEGGIFALYTLVRRNKYKWLIVPAIIGGSALLADGIITPPITVTSAIEGIQNIYYEVNVVPIVIFILILLFVFQRAGTDLVGKSFGPIMLVWFLMLGILGGKEIIKEWSVLSAFNPIYAFELIQKHPEGIFVLGAVFLCTTGAEALYSDMGHCGRKNIRISWIFVKIMLLLNYFGQGAWLLKHEGYKLSELGANGNPFFLIVPDTFLVFSILIATMAAIIASQALISGSFTLVNEAMRLNIFPKLLVKYPTELRGQLYIPVVNWLMLGGCIFIVLFFKESTKMEAAYGLAIILTMLMTTTLLNFYLHMKRYNIMFIVIFIGIYVIIESILLYANLSKFFHGGYITLAVAGALSFVMGIWYTAKKLSERYVDTVKLEDYKKYIIELSADTSIPKYATHLVYLTSVRDPELIEQKIIHSILQRRPKRADIYWFIHVDVVDEPYRMEYRVTHIAKDDIIRVDFYLGFRIAPRINLMFRKVVEELVKNKEVDITSRYESLQRNNISGDFKFVIIEKYLSYDNELPFFEKLIFTSYYILKKFSLSEGKAFGLDMSVVKIEKYPMIFRTPSLINLKRIE